MYQEVDTVAGIRVVAAGLAAVAAAVGLAEEAAALEDLVVAVAAAVELAVVGNKIKATYNKEASKQEASLLM